MVFHFLGTSKDRRSNSQKYAQVTKAISRHGWGQILFCGRYYQAELNDSSEGTLPVGVRVIVYAERDISLLVGLDVSTVMPHHISRTPPDKAVISQSLIPVFPG
ncbi:MAG: hypothetical protein HC799_05265 [Limnothrix sp. RL_2_0]|nr:hypothetical protein [Limnothrix sp. RL_2_0]